MSLRAFLDGFKNEAALAVHWVLMGPSGHEARPAAGGALRHYTRCAPVAEGMLKSIANTWFLANSAANPHNFEYRCAPPSGALAAAPAAAPALSSSRMQRNTSSGHAMT